MTDIEPQQLSILAKLTVAVAAVMFIVGLLWHGIAYETIQRVIRQLVERPSGPIAFRFMLQPTMAIIAAVHDGRRDVLLGRSPYVWAILHEPRERVTRLREALNATARIILLGLAMDAIYQAIVFDRFYPGESIVIALLLAFLPYVLMRGAVFRLVRRWRGRTSTN